MTIKREIAEQWITDNPHQALVLAVQAHERITRCDCIFDRTVSAAVREYYHLPTPITQDRAPKMGVIPCSTCQELTQSNAELSRNIARMDSQRDVLVATVKELQSKVDELRSTLGSYEGELERPNNEPINVTYHATPKPVEWGPGGSFK